LTGQALVALHRGRDGFAQELAEQAVQMSPDDPQVWFVKGEIARAREELEQSEASYSRAIELDANFVSARLARADLRIVDGRSDDALGDLQAIAAVREDDPYASWLHALVLSMRGEQQQAQFLIAKASSRLLRFSTKYVMNHPPSLLLMSVARLQSNDFEQAFPVLKRYVELQPQDLGARKLLASVQLIRGSSGQALQVLSPEQGEGGEDAQSLALMSQAHSQVGEVDEAARLLWRSLSVRGEHELDSMQKALISLVLDGGGLADQTEMGNALDLDHQFDDLSLMLRVLQHRASALQGDLRVAQLLSVQHPGDASVANFHGALALSLEQFEESRSALLHALSVRRIEECAAACAVGCAGTVGCAA
jgi:Tfp pilus assembly protein PilF